MIKEILIEKEAEIYPFTEEIIKRNRGKVKISFIEKRERDLSSEKWGIAKRRLLLRTFKGKWVRQCPGTKNLLCCNYLVINPVVNCPFNCTYCFLQGYLDAPYIQVMVNIEDLFEELDQFLNRNRNGRFRIGTGEMADSLALDRYIGLNEKLIRFISNYPNAVLELKTKSADVEPLLKISHGKNVVISWSLAPLKITKEEELGTDDLTKRISAMEKVLRAGYMVGFHFDPIIYYEGWERGYREVVESIFTKVPERQLAWVSMGSLRFFPQHLESARKRFPHHTILFQEMVPGADRKLRYPKPVRIEMYRKIYTWIKSIRPGAFIYLCMEGKDVWKKVFGFAPENDVKVGELFFRYSGALVNFQ